MKYVQVNMTKEFGCPHCNKKFAAMTHLQDHAIAKHGKMVSHSQVINSQGKNTTKKNTTNSDFFGWIVLLAVVGTLYFIIDSNDEFLALLPCLAGAILFAFLLGAVNPGGNVGIVYFIGNK